MIEVSLAPFSHGVVQSAWAETPPSRMRSMEVLLIEAVRLVLVTGLMMDPGKKVFIRPAGNPFWKATAVQQWSLRLV